MGWGNYRMPFSNTYEDPRRAESYGRLEFAGTYYLAFRDLPEILRQHVTGTRALDFGCGAGRSTRFLASLGFDVLGVDISEAMLRLARDRAPRGEYRLLGKEGLSELHRGSLDLALAAFPFDNIPTAETKVRLLSGLRDLLRPDGKIVNLVSSPDIYTHEWASFTTREFPENWNARTGDRVLIIGTDVEDRRPVEDIFWDDDAYRDVYRRAGLDVAATYRPLGSESEPYAWVSETKIAPWVIYVLRRNEEQPDPRS